jgi:hypothetical protein
MPAMSAVATTPKAMSRQSSAVCDRWSATALVVGVLMDPFGCRSAFVRGSGQHLAQVGDQGAVA